MLLRVKMVLAGLATDTRLHEHFIKVSLRIQAENPRLRPTSGNVDVPAHSCVRTTLRFSTDTTDGGGHAAP